MSILSFIRKLFATNSDDKINSVPTDNPSQETIRFSVSLDETPKIKRSPEEIAHNRKKMDRKGYRLNRNRLIWAIERHFVEYYTLSHADNIYDFRSSWERREDYVKTLSEFNPTKKDFFFAYRLIRIKCAKGECVDYEGEIPELTKNIINQVFNTDKEVLLDGLYDRMKIYWDEVLGTYKNDFSKKRRVDYLINRLNEEQKISLISEYPKIVNKINKLIEHYSSIML